MQPVILVDEANKTNGKSLVMKADSSIWVEIDDKLLFDLKEVVGSDCVAVK
jgi:hypothetical protein